MQESASEWFQEKDGMIYLEMFFKAIL